VFNGVHQWFLILKIIAVGSRPRPPDISTSAMRGRFGLRPNAPEPLAEN
jgi:hypothetical protein